jgi:hypothetical protein
MNFYICNVAVINNYHNKINKLLVIITMKELKKGLKTFYILLKFARDLTILHIVP